LLKGRKGSIGSVKECVVIRRSGGFYNVFEDDAIIVSYITGYKIVGGRCGFPLKSLGKIVNLLDDNKVNYVVRESMKDIMKNNYKKNNKYSKILDRGKKKINVDYRVNMIMNMINELSYDRLNSLLDVIEDYINE